MKRLITHFWNLGNSNILNVQWSLRIKGISVKMIMIPVNTHKTV